MRKKQKNKINKTKQSGPIKLSNIMQNDSKEKDIPAAN